MCLVATVFSRLGAGVYGFRFLAWRNGFYRPFRLPFVCAVISRKGLGSQFDACWLVANRTVRNRITNPY
jgi:hypothetical protein